MSDSLTRGRPGSPAGRIGYHTERDPVEVETVLARRGEPGIGWGLSRPDRIAVAAALTEKNFSARQIAEALGVAERSVRRYRKVTKEMMQ